MKVILTWKWSFTLSITSSTEKGALQQKPTVLRPTNSFLATCDLVYFFACSELFSSYLSTWQLKKVKKTRDDCIKVSQYFCKNEVYKNNEAGIGEKNTNKSRTF